MSALIIPKGNMIDRKGFFFLGGKGVVTSQVMNQIVFFGVPKIDNEPQHRGRGTHGLLAPRVGSRWNGEGLRDPPRQRQYVLGEEICCTHSFSLFCIFTSCLSSSKNNFVRVQLSVLLETEIDCLGHAVIAPTLLWS